MSGSYPDCTGSRQHRLPGYLPQGFFMGAFLGVRRPEYPLQKKADEAKNKNEQA